MIAVRPLILAIALAAPALGWAQDIPDAGIAAEMRQDWAEATSIYRDVLEQRPGDAVLWQRLAQVQAAAGDTAGAAESYGQAARLTGNDASLHFEHSRALGMAGDLEGALAANGRALDLDPDNVDYLLARSQLASWLGDSQTSNASLQRALAAAPERTEVLADVARTKAWTGQLDDAILLMNTYLESHPADRAAGLDLVRFHSWTGDYARTIEELDAFEARVGADDESRAVRAYVLAWAGRRHESLALNTPLLDAKPDDYLLNYAQAIALRQGQIPGRARAYVERVKQIQPDSKETRDLVRSTRVVLASKVIGWFDFFEDSDDIRTLNYGVDGRWVRSDQLTLLAGIGERRVRAPIAGPFAPDSGGNNVHDRRLTVGARYAIDDDYAVTARVGVSDLDTQDSKAIYALELDALASDTFSFLVGLERDRVTASPRSLDRDITRTGAYTRVKIRPDLRNTIDIGGAFNDQSDDNEGVHINGVWRRAMIRTPDLQLDAGLSGEWIHFERDNDNGYYSPDNYRRIGALVGAYVPLTSESGLSVQLGLGVQRDETFDDWERASDVSVEYTKGIFSDWQLKVRAGYVERVQNTGAFEGAAFGVTLERRF